jgi:hypothetical protein
MAKLSILSPSAVYSGSPMVIKLFSNSWVHVDLGISYYKAATGTEDTAEGDKMDN